ncbi:hypothetical protein B0H21DRAFT_705714 [Amylocystis lapponica]|nr:hypothetical protein B0H21DRAFT_705714 [Amylocystis lapponica]
MPLNHRGFGAFITCEGKELELYAVKVEDETTITCWIASEAGRTLRRYQFAKLNLTDDDDIASPKVPVSEELGTIEVRIRRIRDFQKGSKPPAVIAATDIGPVHEQSKKAGTNCVGFGTETRVAPAGPANIPSYIDDTSYVTFRFRHRPAGSCMFQSLSRAAIDTRELSGILQANGIMPLPPRPDIPHPSKSRNANKKRPSEKRNPSTSIDGNPSKRARTTVEDKDEKPLVISDDDDDNAVELKAQLGQLQKKLEAKKSKKPSFVKREQSPIRVSATSAEVIEILSD